MSEYIIYVDGSFNSQRLNYGGGYLILAYDMGVLNLHKTQIGYFKGSHPDIVTENQIPGECGATLLACQQVSQTFNNKFDSIEIRYDYLGIEKWACDIWKAKKQSPRAYKAAMQEYINYFDKCLKFKHIRGHRGELGNEYVDKLAKYASGVNKNLPKPPYFAKHIS